MSFPSNPVDGQRYKQYVYDATNTIWEFEPEFFDGMPVGISVPFFGTILPAGWMRIPKNAKTLNRSQYAELWDAFGNEDWFAPDSSAATTAAGNNEFHLPTVNDAYLREGIHGSVDSVDTTNNVITISDEDGNTLTDSDLRNGIPFRFRSTGSLPGGITDAYTVYYLFWDSANSGWSLHSTEDNAISNTSEVSLTSTGSGTISATQYGIDLDDAMQGHYHKIWSDTSGIGEFSVGRTRETDDTGGSPVLFPGNTGGSQNWEIRGPRSDGVDGTPRTTNESRGRTSYGRYIIKVESNFAPDSAASSIFYDSGFSSSITNWVNADFNVSHNLNENLSGLIVRLFLSSDGTETNSFEVSGQWANGSNNDSEFGYWISQVDLNTIKIETGDYGLMRSTSDGIFVFDNTDTFYYRVIAYKPQFMFSRAKKSPYRTVTADYTIGSSDATTILADATSNNVAVTLPLVSSVNNGDERKVIRIDSSANTVTVQRQGSDIIGPGSATSVELTAEDDSATFVVENGKWMNGAVLRQLKVTRDGTTLIDAEQGIWPVTTPPAMLLVHEGNTNETSPVGIDTWGTTPLNSEKHNAIQNATFNSSTGVIALPPGDYYVDFSQFFMRTNDSLARLQDVTNNVTLVQGQQVYSDSDADGSSNSAHGKGYFTLSSSASVELQHWYSVSSAYEILRSDSGPAIIHPGSFVHIQQTNEIMTQEELRVGPIMLVEDQKADGTNGGTATTGSKQTRDLNTVVINSISGASLSSNQITLPAGTYKVNWTSAFYRTSSTITWIWDITNDRSLARSPNDYNDASSAVGALSSGSGRFELQSQTVIELQYEVATSTGANDLGGNSSFGTSHEMYSQVQIEQVEETSYVTEVTQTLYEAPLFHVEDQKPSGTAGGTFNSGAWQTRDLTAEVTNTITGASLSGNQITLPAGTYEVYARAPGYSIDRHIARLYNISDSATIMLGASEYSNDGGNSISDSIIMGKFSLATSKTLEIQHQCETNHTNTGFGVDIGSGFTVDHEVYTQVWIKQVG